MSSASRLKPVVAAVVLAPIVPFGFQVFTATDVTIADLSVGNVYYHAVAGTRTPSRCGSPAPPTSRCATTSWTPP